MNEMLNMDGEIMMSERALSEEIALSIVEGFKQLPQKFQMSVIGIGIVSTIGLVAYAIHEGYSFQAESLTVSKNVA